MDGRSCDQQSVLSPSTSVLFHNGNHLCHELSMQITHFPSQKERPFHSTRKGLSSFRSFVMPILLYLNKSIVIIANSQLFGYLLPFPQNPNQTVISQSFSSHAKALTDLSSACSWSLHHFRFVSKLLNRTDRHHFRPAKVCCLKVGSTFHR